VEEWFESIYKAQNAMLKGSAKKTIEKLEMATGLEDYTCANLLVILGNGK